MIRFFDVFFSIIGLIVLSPFFVLISILIKINSKGPIFYKQKRVGISNVDFLVLKFRTMHIDADQLGLLTVGAVDPRITSLGHFLRKFKLDELPQLFNVLIGNMSLVGPRPEVRKYVNYYSEEQLKVLEVKPGITDWASIKYRDENLILAKSVDPEKDYVEKVIKDKIRYNLIFIQKQTLKEYFKIIFFTIWRILYSKKGN
jgi:lipopolysaccharide/colanic/teichoic acid biosynthesis glycosyltransferase